MAVDEVEELGDLFQEPNDYYMPEKPATFAAHTLLSGETMRLRLVGHNPLWVRTILGESSPQLMDFVGTSAVERRSSNLGISATSRQPSRGREECLGAGCRSWTT